MTDPVQEVLRVLASAAPGDGTPILLIDGRSGSGKTTLAVQLQGALPGARLVRLDDIYPGWDGLAAGSEAVLRELLVPLARGRAGGWRRWDWVRDRSGDWNSVSPGPPVIVEGCGALTAAGRALASAGVWVDLDDATRRRRALKRDGSTYEPFWDRWAAQEADFIEREQPRAQADLVVDGHTIAE